MTQESGDIKIGKITSKGDVTLNALNGAIVNSVDTAVNMTGAADKISAWQAAGLISDKDSANSATNAAQEEKAVRLEGLENLFKRWALKVDGTVDKKLYNQFINDTVDRTKLTEEQNIQLSLYTSLKYTANFGFSKNQLLYAVQESLLNPSAGTTANISDPIITGKNISLYAKSIGKELEPVTYSNLSSLATLKKLALAKGGDVTYNKNGTITVKEQSPITVKQLSAEDKLNIRTQGNTFISGTDDTKFNVNTPVTAGSGKVVLMTGNGIYSKKGITAKEIELYAGAGDLTANLEAGTSKVMSTVQEPIITTTITYETYTIPLRTLFDRYKNIPGFSVKGEEIGFLNYKCTLTAEYEPNDTTALKALDEAMKAVENPYSVYPSQYTKNAKVTTYSRNDEYGTRDVEKMVEVENDSVGTLTANALGEINIKSYASLPIKNVTSGKDTIIKAEGNIAPIDEKSFIRAEDIDLTAANDIGTKEIPLTIFADAMIFNAKNVYVSDGDPTGGEEGEGSGNNNGGGNSSGNGNNYTATTMTTTPTNESSPILNNNALLSTKNIVNVTAPANNSSTDKPNITATIINQLDKFSHSLNDTKLLNPESLYFINKMTLKSSPDNSFQILDDTPVNTEGVDNVTEGAMTFNTAPNQEYYKVALALSRSSALKNKSGYVYSAAAKTWLSGMGYSEEEEQQIIKLSAEIAFNKFSSNSLLNVGIADIVSKYSGSNLNAKKFHDK